MTTEFSQPRDYKGLRALLLTRVSTAKQEEMFGPEAQEAEIRTKLIKPLALRLDEQKHVKHDTYTGLEFKQRPMLLDILEMAERKEFDVLCMDVLDRLGRKGMERKLYRMQLRELGIRILTTDPNERADDDSFIGGVIRMFLGLKAEQELNDIRRRTMNGKRQKVLGEKDPEHQHRHTGSGTRKYGYAWTYNAKHKRDGYVLNLDIIKVDADGAEWTEGTVVLYVFSLADNGMPIRQIAIRLNEMGIPTLKGGIWQPSTIANMLNSREYAEGCAYMFKEMNGERIPGKKSVPKVKRPEAEQIKVPIPQIIDMGQYQRVQARLENNKKFARRKNQHPEQTLLRAGLIKCAECGGNMSVYRRLNYYKDKEGPEAEKLAYRCSRMGMFQVCKGCTIEACKVDAKVWAYAVSKLRDPAQIDKRMKELASNQSTEQRRKKAEKELADIQKALATFRRQLADFMMRGTLDKETEDFLSEQLKRLSDD